MLEAVLDGDGLAGVAELAAAEAGRAQWRSSFRRAALSARVPRWRPRRSCINGLAEYAKARLADADASPPHPIAGEEPVIAGGEMVGMVLASWRPSRATSPTSPIDRERGAPRRRTRRNRRGRGHAMPARRPAQAPRQADLEELRAEPMPAAEATEQGRAARLRPERAAPITLVAQIEIDTAAPRGGAGRTASIEGSVAELADGRRVYAILPARGGRRRPRADPRAGGADRRAPARPRTRRGLVLLSRPRRAPPRLPRGRAGPRRDHPRAANRRGPRGRHRRKRRLPPSLPRPDLRPPRRSEASTTTPSSRSSATTRQYRSDLLGTLEEYLASDCNMNATARAIYAHRHTVAYRLDRVRELTRPRPRRYARTASGSASASRRTGSSPRPCRASARGERRTAGSRGAQRRPVNQ